MTTAGLTEQSPAQAELSAAGDEPRECVRIWDLMVRVTHWAIALSLAVLAVTGIYIGRPFLSVSGPAGAHFVMGTIKAIHMYAAIVFSLAVVSRIVWMFIGTRHARWNNFIPVSRERRREAVEMFLFYTFLRRHPPAIPGHNPLAGMAYLAVFGLYLVMIATGIALEVVNADTDSLLQPFRFLLALFGGPQTARFLHHVVMWLLIGFFVHHLYSAMLVAVVEKNGTIDSIFSGNKWLTKSEADKERAAARAENAKRHG
jgi:Ni/Fe-hydrogenase 1 B-type cytochrome subunit